MTKKRTSALASIKMLIVIPVLAVIFLAISASKSELMPPPPPPPPPQSTGLNDNIKIVMDESVDDSGSAPVCCRGRNAYVPWWRCGTSEIHWGKYTLS